VNITAAQLLYGFDTYVKLPFEADFFMLVPQVIEPDGLNSIANGTPGVGYGVRVGDANGPVLIMAPSTDNQAICVFEGTVSEIYIRPLFAEGSAPITAPLQILIGKNCDLGFVGGVQG
jgi:hypothetical protein